MGIRYLNGNMINIATYTIIREAGRRKSQMATTYLCVELSESTTPLGNCSMRRVEGGSLSRF